MTYSSIRQRVDALPEPERSSRRMLHTDWEWNNLWSLNAWDHQLPPLGDDWKAWTLIGSRRCGKTIAGYKWLSDKLFAGTGSKLLAVTRYPTGLDILREWFYADTIKFGGSIEYKTQNRGGYTEITSPSGRTLHIVKERMAERDGWYTIPHRDYDYVWADEIESAPVLMDMLPRTHQFVFTGPTKLPEETLLSRAGV